MDYRGREGKETEEGMDNRGRMEAGEVMDYQGRGGKEKGEGMT